MADKLAILIRRLGPYHVARLKALAAQVGKNDVVALEVCARDDVYGWDAVDVANAFERHTLFADAAAARPVGALWRRLQGALDEVNPSAAFFPGWSDPAALGMLRYCRQREIPGIMMSDSTEMDGRRTWWQEGVKRRIVGLADSMLVAGTRHVAYAEKLGMPRTRIHTGYDVVDNDFFSRGGERRTRRAGVPP